MLPGAVTVMVECVQFFGLLSFFVSNGLLVKNVGDVNSSNSIFQLSNHPSFCDCRKGLISWCGFINAG